MNYMNYINSKKIGAMVMALAMVGSIFAVGPALASHSVTVSQSPQGATTVSPGDTVAVNVTIDANPGSPAITGIDVPSGWSFDWVYTDNPAAESGDELTWNEDVNSQNVHTVTYEVTVPSGASDGTYSLTANGAAQGPDSVDDDESDSDTLQVTVESESEPDPSGDNETEISLSPSSQSGGVGATSVFDVVVENAAGGVGAGEIQVSLDNDSVAAITDVSVGNGADVDKTVTESSAEFDYFNADTADSGSVTIATVTVEGASVGTTSLSIEPTSNNNEVLLFDEAGTGYTITGTNGATYEVTDVEFLVDSTDAPEKVAVGETATINATISNDGATESTQGVTLQVDVNDDGDLEAIETQDLTIGAGEQTEVSFDLAVPESSDFGDRDFEVVATGNSISGVIEFTPPDVNGDGNLPDDPNNDGLYEDVNGDGLVDTGDAQTLFDARDDSVVLDYVSTYDFNGDGELNVGDAQALFALAT